MIEHRAKNEMRNGYYGRPLPFFLSCHDLTDVRGNCAVRFVKVRYIKGKKSAKKFQVRNIENTILETIINLMDK